MDLRIVGRGLFALGVIGIGILSLIFHSYALQWQPVPAGLPAAFVYISAAILIAGGVGLFLPRLAFAAGALLAMFLAIWVVGLQAPLVAKDIKTVATWLGLAEDLAMACGAWTLMAMSAQTSGGPDIPFLTDANGLRLARGLFGFACLIFGASHFVYADFTAQMVPHWLPQRVWWAYLTGAGHCAAGLALLIGFMPKLAATLEAAMMTCFVVLVHIPMVLARPADGVQLIWTMLFVACTLSASAWAISGSQSERPLA